MSVPPTALRRAMLFKERMIEPNLRQVEQARKAITQGNADILFFGDSSCLWDSPEDADHATIPELIGRQFPDAKMVPVIGPGYGAYLLAEVLRYLGTLDARPRALVFAVAIRAHAMTHVTKHPQFSYAHVRRTLAAAPDARRRLNWLGQGVAATAADYAEFEAWPVQTKWGGQSTIGAFRSRLDGQTKHPMPPEVAAQVFDYFHGELLTEGHHGLQAVARFGEQLRAYDVPTAAYWTAPPLDQGEAHYPGEFAAHVRENLRRLEAALNPSGDPGLKLIDAGIEEPDFANHYDGTEHYALSGRRKVADAVSKVLSATL